MPRPRKAPRLYLRGRSGRCAIWVIRDGTFELSTGCGPADQRGAEEALARYLAGKYTPPRHIAPSDLFVIEVVAAYLKGHAQHSASREFLIHTATPIMRWWDGKKLAEVNGGNCRAYIDWRTSQTHRRSKVAKPISPQTARHELKTLRTAINWYHGEYGPLPALPKVTLPPRKPARIDYWLSRAEVAKRIRVARGSSRTAHIARQLLIGVYTGTRPGAILRLGWMPNTRGGWFDLENEVLHRAPTGSVPSKKRQPSARIHQRLLPHLRRWRAADLAAGIPHVVHYFGAPVQKLRNSWATVAKDAGAAGADGPHITRHTAATWQMQAGTNLYEAAGYLGMTPETLWEVYGHHHPDFQAGAAKAAGRRTKEGTPQKRPGNG